MKLAYKALSVLLDTVDYGGPDRGLRPVELSPSKVLGEPPY